MEAMVEIYAIYRRPCDAETSSDVIPCLTRNRKGRANDLAMLKLVQHDNLA